MKLLIDADGCPVMAAAASIAKQRGVECVAVADTSHSISLDGVSVITVSKGSDSADIAIANLVNPGDIVVTQDYGLAAICLARGGRPLNQNGLIYTDENIDSLLSQRHLAGKIRRAGGKTKGPKKRTSEQDSDFAAALLSLFRDICDVSKP